MGALDEFRIDVDKLGGCRGANIAVKVVEGRIPRRLGLKGFIVSLLVGYADRVAEVQVKLFDAGDTSVGAGVFGDGVLILVIERVGYGGWRRVFVVVAELRGSVGWRWRA
jgi:hypothetical protein